jgi:hypothetical protein
VASRETHRQHPVQVVFDSSEIPQSSQCETGDEEIASATDDDEIRRSSQTEETVITVNRLTDHWREELYRSDGTVEYRKRRLNTTRVRIRFSLRIAVAAVVPLSAIAWKPELLVSILNFLRLFTRSS